MGTAAKAVTFSTGGGNPSNYDTSGDQEFDVIHCAIWIESGLPGAGNILVFNNGEGQRASSVVELIPDFDSWSSGTGLFAVSTIMTDYPGLAQLFCTE